MKVTSNTKYWGECAVEKFPRRIYHPKKPQGNVSPQTCYWIHGRLKGPSRQWRRRGIHFVWTEVLEKGA